MSHQLKAEVIELDSPSSKRVKLKVEGSTVGLGYVESYSQLARLAKEAVAPYGISSFYLSARDQDGEDLTITTQLAYAQAVERATHSVYLHVTPRHSLQKAAELPIDYEFPIKAALDSLRGVFRVVSGSRVIGLGCLLANGLGLVCRRIIPDAEVADRLVALFEDPDFQYEFDSRKFDLVSDHLTVVGFKAHLAIRVRPIERADSLMEEGQVFYTLAKPVKSDVKASLLRIEVKEIVTGLRIFITKDACGPAGSPVFDDAFRLVGMMVTECAFRSEAVSLKGLVVN